MNAQAFARALTKSLTEPPLARIVLRQARIGYCPACGTSVRTDDVLGVIERVPSGPPAPAPTPRRGRHPQRWRIQNAGSM